MLSWPCILIGKEEAESIAQFMAQQESDWKKISVEIKSIQSMFEEGIDKWKCYNACLDVLTAWITEGEAVMNGSMEDKQQHFSELPEMEEKHKLMNDSANFLIETTKEPIAAEIKQTVLMINRRFKDLVDGFHHFQQVEVIGRARQNYGEGVQRISEWLKSAEELLVQEVPCVHTSLKDHLQDMDVSAQFIPILFISLRV